MNEYRISKKIMIGFQNIEPKQKIKCDLKPFVTFPLTKSCTFRCLYCGEGGELTASKSGHFDFDSLVMWVKQCREMGIVKFRLTGGEPLLHPKIRKIFSLFPPETEYLLVNSNGVLVKKKCDKWGVCGSNTHFAISLDSLREEAFDRLSQSSGYFKFVLQGIEALSDAGLLLRLNTVVNRYNINEIFDIVDYCAQLRCNLKLLGVVSVPMPHFLFDELYVPMDELEAELDKRSINTRLHEYARSFGTPCRIYDIDGVQVTVKSISQGSRYDMQGICKDCKLFPCHEGLYDVFVLPDGRGCGCRWSASSVAPSEKPREIIKWLKLRFQLAAWYKPDEVRAMPVLEELF